MIAGKMLLLIVGENGMKSDKSVLVIDTPNNCSECPCCYVLVNGWGDFISASCQMKYKGFVDEYCEYNDGRPSWCPLRPLNKETIGEIENDYLEND